MSTKKNCKPASVRAKGFSRLIRRFQRGEHGASAVEFAMIASPCFMLFFAVIEVTMLFWTSQALETAVANASRTILTGQAVSKYPVPATALGNFKNDVCANMTTLIDCQATVSVDVRSYTSFATANASVSTAGGTIDTSGFAYQTPGPNQIFVVRAVMEYPLTIPNWSNGLANLNSGKRALVASAAFRTEPF